MSENDDHTNQAPGKPSRPAGRPQTTGGASISSPPGTSDPIGALAFRLLEAMQQPGCPICRLTQEAVHTYLDGISYEAVNDPQVRADLRKSLGYCAVHGHEWLGVKDALGTAIIYRDVLHTILVSLQTRVATEENVGVASNIGAGQDTSSGSGGDGGLMDRLQDFLAGGGEVGGRGQQGGTQLGHTLAEELLPGSYCPACEYTLELESRMASAFAQGLTDAQFNEAYRRHDMGLCLPHLRDVLRLIASPDLLTSAVQVQEAALVRTCGELDEVIRKNDYRYSDEPKGEEFQAPARAVEQACGTLPTHLNLSNHSPR